MLQKNEAVPLDTIVKSEKDEMIQLQKYFGSWVVVYFYPKDDSPGCTLEAEGFRDQMSNFKNLGATVFGVSKDTQKSHQKFIEKININFTLISDTEHKLMEAFGVWGERKMAGQTYMGATRSTFLIDPKGAVAHVWEKAKPEGHAEEVFQVLQQLQEE